MPVRYSQGEGGPGRVGRRFGIWRCVILQLELAERWGKRWVRITWRGRLVQLITSSSVG